MRIDDERDLHEQLEVAFGAITPRPAPVDGATRRGRAIRVRRRVAVVAGAAAVVAIGALAVPSLLHRSAAAGPVAPVGGNTVTVQAPGPHSAPGLIASGTIDGRRWQLTAAKPGTGAPGPGEQIFTTSGPAFEGHAGPQPWPALVVNGADSVPFSGGLVIGPVQVMYGAVPADVTYVAVRLGNGAVLTLHPAAVYGVRAVAFAVPVGARIVDAAAYSQQGEIAAAIPFNDSNGRAYFGLWLTPGQHGLARASGRIGSGTANGTAWSVTAYLGPWGICYQTNAVGIPVVFCPLTPSDLDSGGLWGSTERSPSLSVAGGHAPAFGGLGHREPAQWHHDQDLAGHRGRPEALRLPAANRPESAELEGLRQLRARGQVAGLTPGLRWPESTRRPGAGDSACSAGLLRRLRAALA